MAFSITRFIKGLRVYTSGTSNPANMDITPGGTAGTTTTIQGAQTVDRTLTLPDATDTLVGKATTDTLSNKTLDNSTVINVKDTNLSIQDDADATKQVKFNVSGVTTATTRTLDVPDEDTTIVGTNATQSIGNKALNNTNSITVKDVNLTIQDDADVTKAVKFQASTITTGTTRTLSMPDADTTLVGTNASQNLSNKTIDNSNTVTLQDSNLTIQDNSDNTKQLKFEASGITTGTTRTLTAPDANTTIVGTDATQTLSNKTISGSANTITNVSLTTGVTGTLPLANGGTGQTTATAAFNALSPITNKGDIITKGAGDNVRLPVGADGQVLTADSSQVNGLAYKYITGVKNYVTNGDAESNTNTGWVTYADAAGATPVDGTGGSPTVTFSSSPSTPLRGNYSFVFTKGGTTNRQGEGVAYAFTVDEADKAKPISISFDYKVFSGTYASGDMAVYIYDVTNSQVIQPSGYSILNVSGSAVQKAEFQTNSNSTSYRLIFHVASTSAVDYQIQFDNVVVGPVTTSIGPAESDWASFTMSITDASNNNVKSVSPTTNVAWWKRVGDSMLINFKYSHTSTAGTAGTGLYRFKLPTGYRIDSSKATSGGINFSGSRLGSGYGATVTATAASGELGFITDAAGDPDYVIAYYSTETTSPTPITATSNLNFGKQNVEVGGSFEIPIKGWSSNSVVSSDTDTRVVALQRTTNASQTLNEGVFSWIEFEDGVFDTHGAWRSAVGAYSAASGTWATTQPGFVCPVPGYYSVDAVVTPTFATSTSYYGEAFVYVDNVQMIGKLTSASTGSAVSASSLNVSGLVYCNAGQVIQIKAYQVSGANRSLDNSGTKNYVSIRRLSGPSQIAASESVNARYYSTSTAISGSAATIVWTTKDYDSHSAMSSGVFTCPAPGKYQVNSGVIVNGTYSLNASCSIVIQKNGSNYSGRSTTSGGNQTSADCWISDIVSCNAGDTIRIQVSSSATSPTIPASAAGNYVSIARIGN